MASFGPAGPVVFALIVPLSSEKKYLEPVFPGDAGAALKVKLSESTSAYVKLYPCFVPLARTLSIYGGSETGNTMSESSLGYI